MVVRAAMAQQPQQRFADGMGRLLTMWTDQPGDAAHDILPPDRRCVENKLPLSNPLLQQRFQVFIDRVQMVQGAVFKF